MINTTRKKKILTDLIEKLGLEEKRKKLISPLLDSYCAILWKTMNYEEQKLFLENSQMFDLSDNISSSIFDIHTILFSDKFNKVIEDYVTEPIIDRSTISFGEDLLGIDIYSWDNFSVDEAKNQKIFNNIKKVTYEYSSELGKYVDIVKVGNYVPNCILFQVNRNKKDKLAIYRIFSRYYYYDYDDDKEVGNIIGTEDDEDIKLFLHSFGDYIDSCRRICNLVIKLCILLKNPNIDIKYLRTNLPEIL